MHKETMCTTICSIAVNAIAYTAEMLPTLFPLLILTSFVCFFLWVFLHFMCISILVTFNHIFDTKYHFRNKLLAASLRSTNNNWKKKNYRDVTGKHQISRGKKKYVNPTGKWWIPQNEHSIKWRLYFCAWYCTSYRIMSAMRHKRFDEEKENTKLEQINTKKKWIASHFMVEAVPLTNMSWTRTLVRTHTFSLSLSLCCMYCFQFDCSTSNNIIHTHNLPEASSCICGWNGGVDSTF